MQTFHLHIFWETFEIISFVACSISPMQNLPLATHELGSIATSDRSPSLTTPIHSLRLKNQVATSIAMDQTFIYWTPAPNSGQILRYPLEGGKVDIVATSRFNRFNDGYLGSFGLQREGDWLIFTDTRENDNSIWTVRALNVTTGQEEMLLEEPGDPSSWPGPDYASDNNWVVWARIEQANVANCAQSILAVRNLVSRENRELDRVCITSEYKWANPQISQDKIIVEQDLPTNKGGGNDIYLFDLSSGKRTALTNNRSSSMPSLSDKWLVWKNAPRYNNGDVLIIYDLNSGQKRSMHAPFEYPSDPRVKGHWLYWLPQATKPFIAFNLETGRFLTIATPGKDEVFDSVAIVGNTAAWDRHPDFSSGKLVDHFLEWRALP